APSRSSDRGPTRAFPTSSLALAKPSRVGSAGPPGPEVGPRCSIRSTLPGSPLHVGTKGGEVLIETNTAAEGGGEHLLANGLLRARFAGGRDGLFEPIGVEAHDLVVAGLAVPRRATFDEVIAERLLKLHPLLLVDAGEVVGPELAKPDSAHRSRVE